jgi:hypothetical protein
MKVSTEIDNNFGYEKITQLVDNIPLNIPTGPPQTNWTRIFSERSLFYLERILKMTNVPINTVKNNNKAAPYFERFNIPTVLMVMFIV